jgi:glycosyltransferase involved in cell wall biosynthesis
VTTTPLVESSTEISVVINTRNEERNLPVCLRSVSSWAADLVVVDMQSTDATREIAARYGARVFAHEPLGFADPARAFAVAQARCGWILILDADELVPPGLRDELLRVAAGGEADVVEIPRHNYMFGAPIDHTGWGAVDDRQARFFRRGALSTTGEIHRFLHPEPWARILRLPFREDRALVHFNYLTVAQYVDRLNRYTTIEAEQALARGGAPTPASAAGEALWEWARRFVGRRGFLDGWRGLFLAFSMAFYRLAAAAKQHERREVGTPEEIEARYRAIAEAHLAGYGDGARPR